MKTFVQPGDVLTLVPTAAVPAGTGFLFGAALFGVAVADTANGAPGAFIVEGVINMPKTSALAIPLGARVFWDATNKVVNTTAAAQQCIGLAVEAAANPSASVAVRLGHYVPVAT